MCVCSNKVGVCVCESACFCNSVSGGVLKYVYVCVCVCACECVCVCVCV